MCGIAGWVGSEGLNGQMDEAAARSLAQTLAHRGPDGEGVWVDQKVALGNRRLAVLDLSSRGHQPMVSHDGRFVMTYNGEVYNYIELKAEVGGHFETGTDTEVVLEAFARWGSESLPRLNGMFAFAVWDRLSETLHLVRDRFGVKPLYYAQWKESLYFASEIKTLAAAGIPLEPDEKTWATYLSYGAYDHGAATFFKGIRKLPPGHWLSWHDGKLSIRCWYDLAEAVGAETLDLRPDSLVSEDYQELLLDAVRMRFRSDVPVGVCLSGGLDSSTLVALLHQLFGGGQRIEAYHFACGDPRYDETPWVARLLADRNYPLHVTHLQAADVPRLSEEAITYQEEPFGGLPTLAMIELFKCARAQGTIVLLDGQGLDEQWAGYSYYADGPEAASPAMVPVQGSRKPSHNGSCLAPTFNLLQEVTHFPAPFAEGLRNLRYRDLRYTKLPRALRFNDRASSQVSCELREPFLDYRLVEIAFRQPANRLIREGQHKYLLRQMVARMLPSGFTEAPKRPVQTPQREWLRGELRDWVEDCLSDATITQSGWFDVIKLRQAWERYLSGESDNSFYVWQWISVVLNQRFMESMRSFQGHASTFRPS